MTDKEEVLAKYPDACALQWGLTFWTIANQGITRGTGTTETEAWADAAVKLKEPA